MDAGGRVLQEQFMEKLGRKIGNKNNVKTYLSAIQFFHYGFI
jgi:hypothetical protein